MERQLAHERRGERGARTIAADTHAGQPRELLRAQRQQRARKDHRDHGGIRRVDPASRTRQVDERQVARRRARLPAVLLDHRAAARHHVDLVELRVRAAHVPPRALGSARAAHVELGDLDRADVADDEPIGYMVLGIQDQLERAQHPADEIRMPAATPALWTSLSRNDRTVSQPRAGDRRIPLIGGHVLGGGSSINGMVYIRGNASDYDGWRDEYGCDGWGHGDLLPYFRRAEDRLGVEDLRYRHPLGEAWLGAAIAHGLPVNPDVNGAAQDGAGYLRATMRGGRRRSAAGANLRPCPENLVVQTNSLVTKVLVNPFRELRRAAVPAAALGGDAERSRRYLEVLAPAGHGDELRAVLRVGGTAWGVLALMRGRPGFTAAEVERVADLSAPLAEELREHARRPVKPAADGARPAMMLFAPGHQVTRLIARGCSTAEIADRLHLSTHTVRDYVKAIFGKLGVSTRGELVARLIGDVG